MTTQEYPTKVSSGDAHKVPKHLTANQDVERHSLLQQLIPEKLHLSKIRDLVVFFVPTIYVLGYITWSLNAFHLHLGMLPVIDQQYFVAGIFPFVVVVFVYFIFKVCNHYANLLEDTLPDSFRLVQLILRVIISTFAGLFVITTIFATDRMIGSHRANNALLFEVGPILLAALLCSIFPARLNSTKELPLRPHMVLLPTVILFIGMYLAAISLSYVPSALGGLQPRCAVLDLRAENLAPQTRVDLGLTAAAQSQKVIRTPDAVRVIFMSGQFAVLRISDSAAFPVEVKTDSILFITWQACDGH
jgi:hypothetical protein